MVSVSQGYNQDKMIHPLWQGAYSTTYDQWEHDVIPGLLLSKKTCLNLRKINATWQQKKWLP